MLVRVRDLVYGYGKEPILRGVSLSADEGELVSIIGPNGSGKSTLLKCIAGIHRPWKGVIQIAGQDVAKINKRELNKIVSYLPQETIPPPSLLTVYEYVLLGRVQSLSGKVTVPEEDHKAVIETLNMLELTSYARRYMNELSGGEKQLVYIAQALARKPRILLLDEPLNHLDIKNQFKVIRLLRELTRKLDLCVIIVMHDINQAARYSDKIYLMHEGRIVAEGPPDEVLVPETLEKVYGIKFRIVYDEGVPQVIPVG